MDHVEALAEWMQTVAYRADARASPWHRAPERTRAKMRVIARKLLEDPPEALRRALARKETP